MNVLIFGPPGVGKSTTLERAAQRIGPEYAVDLEDRDNRYLLSLMGWNWMFCEGRLAGRSLIGGADLDPRAKYPGTVKVVLSLDEAAYAKRRAQRDRAVPSKAAQTRQTIQQWMGIEDAIYIEADENALDKILALRDVNAHEH